MYKILVAFVISAVLLVSGLSPMPFTAGSLTSSAWAEGGE
jgi:hypothetical protein